MMRDTIKFIKELDPKNEVSNLNHFRMEDDDFVKVYKVIKTWDKDGIIVPVEFLQHMEFICRYAN
jgi:hypothetical protein